MGAQEGHKVSLPPCDWKGKECKQNHLLKQCPCFIALDEKARLSHLKTKRRCFNCFRIGHNAGNCMSKITCGKCNKRHNTMVHQAWTDRVEKSVAMLTGEGATYSLHTSPVFVAKDLESRRISTNVIHDQGASTSFLSRDLADSLMLSGAAVPITLKTFGATEGVQEAVEVKLRIFDHQESCLLYTSPSPRDRG